MGDTLHGFPFTRVVNELGRGCGFRKPGGLYLVAGGIGAVCGKLPIPLDVCPCCGAGVKFSRGWTWVNLKALASRRACSTTPTMDVNRCSACPFGDSGPERAGLLWVGGIFYPSPDQWTDEAFVQGVSRRIKSIPRGFVVGETWVAVAHAKARKVYDVAWDKDVAPPFKLAPAIFHAFRPQRVEDILTGAETPKQLARLHTRGVTLVHLSRTDGVKGASVTKDVAPKAKKRRGTLSPGKEHGEHHGQ